MLLESRLGGWEEGLTERREKSETPAGKRKGKKRVEREMAKGSWEERREEARIFSW